MEGKREESRESAQEKREGGRWVERVETFLFDIEERRRERLG